MNQHTVALTRVFDAPRSRVFECWTRAEHLQHWFGPKGFTIHSCETDPRLGGVFKLCMREGKTTVSLNAVARGPSDEAAAMLKGMDQGWAQTVDRLGSHLRK